MRAVQCHQFAALDDKGKPVQDPVALRHVLRLQNLPHPLHNKPLQPNQVLIETHYAGIQYPDALQAQGLYQVRPPLPYVPGMDVTGVVVKVGSLCKNGLSVGDHVYATCMKNGGTGGMAEFVVLDRRQVFQLPKNLPMATCANIGRNYFAAYHSLKTIGNVTPRSLVLVDGASGGVGMATIELCKAMGCKIIAGVSTRDKMNGPQQVGADVVLTYGRSKQSFQEFKKQVKQACKTLGHPKGVDLVVDMVQGKLFEAALVSVVRPLGTIALVGFAAGQVKIRPGIVLVKEINVVGSLWGRYAFEYPHQHAENVHEIIQFLASGKIRPRVDRVFPLQEYAQAFELYQHNQGKGNTVVAFQNEGTRPSRRSKL